MEEESQRPVIAIFVSSFMAHCIKMSEKIICICVCIYIYVMPNIYIYTAE